MSICKKIVGFVKQKMLCVKWRIKNPHNTTVVNGLFPIEKVSVGKKTYGTLNIVWMCQDAKISIGNYCSIAPKVEFLVGGEHNYHRISTWPFQSMVYGEKTKAEINRDIIIEDDVWIGYESLIMSGVTIGKGSVVGARSIVTKDIPPYSVFAGNKVIKKRFSDEIIDKIKRIDYCHIRHDENDSYKEYCQTEIAEKNVDEIINCFLNS